MPILTYAFPALNAGVFRGVYSMIIYTVELSLATLCDVLIIDILAVGASYAVEFRITLTEFVQLKKLRMICSLCVLYLVCRPIACV